MQEIHVKRYAEPTPGPYVGSIEPNDRSWVLFVRADGPPELWVAIDPEGSVRRFVPACTPQGG